MRRGAATYGADLLPAPVLEGSVVADSDDTSAASHSIDLTGLSTGSGDSYALVGGTGAASAFSSFSGDTDDTSSEVVTRADDPRASLRSLTINSAFDTAWTATWGGSTRAAVAAFVVSGASSIETDTATGVLSGGLPAHPSYALTGGPHNVLVLDMIVVEGAHVSVPPTAPSGENLEVVETTGASNLPDDEFRATAAVASMTLEGVTSVPAKTWGGMASLDRDWWAVRMVFYP